MSECNLRAARFALIVAVLAASAVSVRADIVEVGGAAVLREPPADIRRDRWESNTEIRGFFERQTTFLSDLTLDHVNTGLVDDVPLIAPGVVLAGTEVQSYLFHADTEDDLAALLSGYVVFDTPILGVLVDSASLIETDDLLGRSAGVQYATSDQFRGLELPAPSLDAFEISGDRSRLDFTLAFGAAFDQIRVVTAVPEPGSLAMLSLMGVTAMRRRRA